MQNGGVVFFSVFFAAPFSSRFLRCLVPAREAFNRRGPSAGRWLVLLAAPFSSRFLRCLISARKYRLANGRWPVLLSARGARETRSPRAVPWEVALPWAALMITQSAAAVPVRDDRGRGSACARVVDDGTGRSVGISVTAKIPSACVCCGVGRRRERQARRRQDEAVQAQHAQAERARRRRAPIFAASPATRTG